MGALESKDSSMGLLSKRQRGKASPRADGDLSLPMKARSSTTRPLTPPVVWPENSVRWQSLYDVYICHSMKSSDTPYAIEMLSYLEGQPDTLRCFLPDRDMEVGSPVATEMCLGTQNSLCWVLLMTPDFLADSWCKYQMHQCLAQAPFSDGRLIPVMLGLQFSQYPVEMKHMFAIRGQIHDKSVFSHVKRAIMAYLTKLVTVTTERPPSTSSSENNQMRSSTTQESTSDMSTSNSATQESTSDMSTRNSTTQESTSHSATQESTSDMSTSNSATQESTSNSATQETTSDVSTRNSTTQETTSDMSTSNSATQETTSDMSTSHSATQETTSDMSTSNSATQETTSDVSTSNSTNQDSTSDILMPNSRTHEFTSDMSTSHSSTKESTSDMCTSNSTNQDSTNDILMPNSRTHAYMSMSNCTNRDSISDMFMAKFFGQESTSDMTTINSSPQDSSDIYCGIDVLTRSTETSLTCLTHRTSIDQPATEQLTKSTESPPEDVNITAVQRPCRDHHPDTGTSCRDPHAQYHDMYTSQDLHVSHSHLYTSCRSIEDTDRDALHSSDGEDLQRYPEAPSSDVNKTPTDSAAFLPREINTTTYNHNDEIL